MLDIEPWGDTRQAAKLERSPVFGLRPSSLRFTCLTENVSSKVTAGFASRSKKLVYNDAAVSMIAIGIAWRNNITVSDTKRL